MARSASPRHQQFRTGGRVCFHCRVAFFHAFRTAANSAINPATDDLGTLGGSSSHALGINSSGQVVGDAHLAGDLHVSHAFRTAANSAINPATDDLGTLGGSSSAAFAINSSGQVVGDAGTGRNELLPRLSNGGQQRHQSRHG